MKASCTRSDRVAEYALQALPAGERPDFEAHVQGCDACREELAGLREVVAGFADWPTDLLRPTSQWDRLARQIGIEAEPAAHDKPAWTTVAPGISTKLLATDQVKGSVSMLVRLAPCTAYPPHTHAGLEELHLLDGELWIEDRLLRPGDYNRAEAGTGDTRVYSETGCTCVLITSFHDTLG